MRKYITNINNYKCINIENKISYEKLLDDENGDKINETNFINYIIDNNITLYYNNKFIKGNRDLQPKITISRNKNYSELLRKDNNYLFPIGNKLNTNSNLYVITKSFISALLTPNSLLYPHVFDYNQYNIFKNKKIFLHEQTTNKDWYNWKTEQEVKNLKLKHFPEDSFVVCVCGRIAINSYPKSLIEAIKRLRNSGLNIYLLILGEVMVSPHRLTPNLYKEIKSYNWIKSFTVDKKEILNYFRFCDILASTYRDYCNHIGGSNKIKEYLLCGKPILCSRGKERENELGKNYPGFYNCRTCDTVPPLCWTKEFLKNPMSYVNEYSKYFYIEDVNGGNLNEINDIMIYLNNILKKSSKRIVAVIPCYGREPLLKYTIRRLYSKNKIHSVIVIGESKSEYLTSMNEGAIFLKFPNKPLGRKWNAGYRFCKKFNPDAVLFVGSSDWISNDWIDIAYSELSDDIGYVCKSGFDMVDIKNKEIRFCKWYGYICNRKNEGIGIGRLISRKLLEKINFSPFNNNQNNSMDYHMYLKCINNNMTIKILKNDSIFLSISCDLWKNMHMFDYHYFACSTSDLEKNKSIISNKNVSDNLELYRNGSIYTIHDENVLYNKFPELSEFISDYNELIIK